MWEVVYPVEVQAQLIELEIKGLGAMEPVPVAIVWSRSAQWVYTVGILEHTQWVYWCTQWVYKSAHWVYTVCILECPVCIHIVYSVHSGYTRVPSECTQ